ncbi:MAG: imidazole glycerol phosphate synthase subunit HisH [bacterium]|nr:imidazole glycerol phosphate synthase subunit HisH [bacterium]
MITIVDYGMGNLRSVQKAFEKVGAEAQICTKPEEIAKASKLILPGVGAFRDAIQALKDQNLVEPILEHANSGKPFLGICLGLQLLFDVSYEDGEYEGLGIIPGKVVRFQDQPGLKIPHMGWNQIDATRPHPLLAGIPEHEHFYFVHSYYVAPDNDDDVAAWTDYGSRFASMVARDNLVACQFHPEKSQNAGLKLLQNFAAF